MTGTDTSHQQTLKRPSESNHATVIVEFSIILSPTYCVPVLWFIFRQLPSNGAGGIDAVYHYLVPQTQQAGLRQVGVMGGISMAV